MQSDSSQLGNRGLSDRTWTGRPSRQQPRSPPVSRWHGHSPRPLVAPVRACCGDRASGSMAGRRVQVTARARRRAGRAKAAAGHGQAACRPSPRSPHGDTQAAASKAISINFSQAPRNGLGSFRSSEFFFLGVPDRRRLCIGAYMISSKVAEPLPGVCLDMMLPRRM